MPHRPSGAAGVDTTGLGFGSGLRPGVFRAPGLGWSGPYPAPHFTGRGEAQPPGRPDIVNRRPAGPWDDWSAGVPPNPWSAGVDHEDPGLVPTVSRTAARGDFSESVPAPRPAPARDSSRAYEWSESLCGGPPRAGVPPPPPPRPATGCPPMPSPEGWSPLERAGLRPPITGLSGPPDLDGFRPVVG